MKFILGVFCIVFCTAYSSGQYGYEPTHHHEIGVELTGMSLSTHGGTFGGALRYGFVSDSSLVVGPSFRYQYNWSKNLETGQGGKTTSWGPGAYVHYRFMGWFFVGAEIEILKNPFNYIRPDKRWSIAGLAGIGVARKAGPVILNVGIFYDIVDGLSGPSPKNPSPLSNGYFIKIKNANPNASGPTGKYLPILGRFSVFIPLNFKGKKDNERYEDDYEYYDNDY